MRGIADKSITAVKRPVGATKWRVISCRRLPAGRPSVCRSSGRSGPPVWLPDLGDRLELDDQAKPALGAAGRRLPDCDLENRDDWRRAEIVVTAVQSLLFNNKYQQLFSPTDFGLGQIVVPSTGYHSRGRLDPPENRPWPTTSLDGSRQ